MPVHEPLVPVDISTVRGTFKLPVRVPPDRVIVKDAEIVLPPRADKGIVEAIGPEPIFVNVAVPLNEPPEAERLTVAAIVRVVLVWAACAPAATSSAHRSRKEVRRMIL
jgi:hypothetical protein